MSGYPVKYFSYFSTKTYVVGTHKKCLNEALLMSTHNIIKKYTNSFMLEKGSLFITMMDLIVYELNIDPHQSIHNYVLSSRSVLVAF